MRSLIIFTLVGAGAQLVDGALGMAFGVTASTLRVRREVAAAQASAAVHLAEVGTTLASGLSHWRFKNIDWSIVAKLGGPGAVGAFLGATVLSSLSTERAAPLMAGILLAIGVYVLLRFSLGRPPGLRGTRNCQDLWIGVFQATSVPVRSSPFDGGCCGVMSVGRSSSLPLWKMAPARTRATRCGAFTARQRACAASISL